MGTSLLLTLAAESGTLQAGAAKIDIAPSVEAALPMSGYADREEGFKGIHNHIYARAIVLGDGSRLAAIVAWELIGVPNAVSEDLFSGLLGILAYQANSWCFALCMTIARSPREARQRLVRVCGLHQTGCGCNCRGYSQGERKSSTSQDRDRNWESLRELSTGATTRLTPDGGRATTPKGRRTKR